MTGDPEHGSAPPSPSGAVFIRADRTGLWSANHQRGAHVEDAEFATQEAAMAWAYGRPADLWLLLTDEGWAEVTWGADSTSYTTRIYPPMKPQR